MALVALAGCGEKSSAAAEKQLAIVEKSGTNAEKCDATKKVRAAYLEEKDEAAYEKWKVREQVTCGSAALDRAEDNIR